MIPYTAGPVVTAIGLAGLLYSEWVGSYLGSSAGPIQASHSLPSPDPSSKPDSFSAPPPSPRSVFNRSIFGSLIFCALGDVLLIPSRHSELFFQAGLFAFLLGHIGFGASFIQRDLSPKATLLSGAAQTIFASIVWRWLSPALPTADRIPVALYTVVLASMGALAIGGAGGWGKSNGNKRWIQIAGAVLFELSDLCVARQQFVAQSFGNPAIGLPLYYLSTTLLATLVWP